MKKILLAMACIAAGLVFACDKKDKDAALAQGQAAVSKAGEFAGSAWRSTVAEANKLTDGSAAPALQSAQKQLEGLRDQMSRIKAPTSLDDLKLDSVKDQIERLRAALTVQKIRAAMDERVHAAMQMKENAEKEIGDVRAKLEQADAEYKDLQDKLDGAQKAYSDASAKVQETAKRVQDATGV